MRKIIALALGIALLFASGICGNAHNSFAQGIDYGKLSLDELKAEADDGNAKAQFNLGCRYFFGDGVPQDKTEAVKWHRKAAEQGNTFGQFALASDYHYGDGVQKDMTEAVKWYRKAAEQGSKAAKEVLAEIENATRTTNTNNTQTAQKEVANNSVAQENKTGYKPNHYYLNLSLDELKAGAEQGDSRSQSILGSYYLRGNSVKGVPQDKAEAVKWLRKAANQGYEPAKNILAEIEKETGTTNTDNTQTAKKEMATNDLFDFLAKREQETGTTNTNNTQTAEKFKRENIPSGNTEALVYLRKFAEQGNAEAQFELGKLYYEGGDEKESVKWVRKAAEQGFEPAKDILRKDLLLRLVQYDWEAAEQGRSDGWSNWQRLNGTARSVFNKLSGMMTGANFSASQYRTQTVNGRTQYQFQCTGRTAGMAPGVRNRSLGTGYLTCDGDGNLIDSTFE